MDELLIKYCKENGYIYVDISHKFKEGKDEKFEYLNKLVSDDKYKKVVAKINFEKINKEYHRAFNKFLNQKDVSKMSLYINTTRQSLYKNDFKINKFHINQFFNHDKRICCICLEGFERKNISCLVCSAKYHTDCLINPKYSYINDNHRIICAICKSEF